MGEFAKQFAIYVGLLLMCMNYTIIAPFYPKVAQDKDIPLWMIGVIFSLYPFFKLLATPFIGKYMQRIGRKKVVIASFILVSISLFILSPIEYLDRTSVLVLSILSRMFGGLGASCMFTSFTTIFISDYPDKMQLMIGRMEASVGVGLMMGPIIGTGLYYINLMAAMLGVGALIIIFAPFAHKMLGTFRDYNISGNDINKTTLFFKPVKNTQKIVLSDLMIVSFLFSSGFLASMLEIHLHTFGMSIIFVSLCFVFQSAVYLVLSLTGGYLFRSVDSRLVMLIGQFTFGIAYLMLAPWKLIFPNEVYMPILSMPLFSVGQCFCYSNFYLVFSIPYMVRSAVDSYGYVEDDILTDVISTFAVFGTSAGEIIGPLAAGFMTEYLGFETTCLIISCVCFLYTVVFFVGTGYLFDLFRGVKHTNKNFSAYSKNDSRSKLFDSDMELEKSVH